MKVRLESCRIISVCRADERKGARRFDDVVSNGHHTLDRVYMVGHHITIIVVVHFSLSHLDETTLGLYLERGKPSNDGRECEICFLTLFSDAKMGGGGGSQSAVFCNT